jgi:hypothetical protein
MGSSVVMSKGEFGLVRVKQEECVVDGHQRHRSLLVDGGETTCLAWDGSDRKVLPATVILNSDF